MKVICKIRATQKEMTEMMISYNSTFISGSAAGFNLATRDSYFTILVGVFTKHIFAKKHTSRIVLSKKNFIYIFIYFSFLININLMAKNNYKLTITYKLN